MARIQCLGSTAAPHIHLHCLVLDEVYRRTEAEPAFQEARAPTRAELEGVLDKIITRLLGRVNRENVGRLAEQDRRRKIAQYVVCGFRAEVGIDRQHARRFKHQRVAVRCCARDAVRADRTRSDYRR